MSYLKSQLKGNMYIVILGLCFFFLAPLLVTHILFSVSAPINWFVAKWAAGDLLGYMISFLTFIGTIFLGYVALQQNKKAYELNKQMQMLHQAQFNSMVNLTYFENNVSVCSDDFIPDETIDMRPQANYEECYYIDTEFTTDSDYPIVQIDTSTFILFNCKDASEKPIYITKGKPTKIRFIIPRYFEAQRNFELRIRFTNIYNYHIDSKIFIDNISSPKSHYNYRLSKFVDVNPNKKQEYDEHRKKRGA